MHKFPVSWLVGALGLVALLLLLSGPVLAVSISIINPSFEEDNPIGWNFDHSPSFNQGFSLPANLPGNPAYQSPDGVRVAYVCMGGEISQTLSGSAIAANTTYILKVYVGNPALPPDPDLTIQPPAVPFHYSVQLWAVGTVTAQLASTSYPGYDPGPRNFEMLTLSYLSDEQFVNEFLEIRLIGTVGNGGYVNFDMVTLDAVPVPPTVWLLGSGLLGLVGLSRFRKS